MKPGRDSRFLRGDATLAAEPKGCYHPVDQRMSGQRWLKVTEEMVLVLPESSLEKLHYRAYAQGALGNPLKTPKEYEEEIARTRRKSIARWSPILPRSA